MSTRGERVCGALPLLALLAVIPPAMAQTASQSTRTECTTFALNVDSIARARDNGVPKARIVEFNANVEKKYVMPAEAIDDVYEFAKLEPVDLMLYWMWECEARARKIPVARLGTVAEQLGRCPRNGDERLRCLDSIRQALKLPADILSGPSGGATAIQDVTPDK